MNEHGWGPGGPSFHDVDGGFHYIHGGAPFAPLLGVGMFLFTLLIIGTVLFLLARSGRIGPPPWVRGGFNGAHRLSPFSPEYEARKTLANRFADGQIDSDEFLERAAALNWTPGVDPRPEQVKSKKRK